MTEAIAHEIAAAGKPVATVALDDVHEDALGLTARGIRIAAGLARSASRLRREPAPSSALAVAVECGHSDATSGLVSNPLAGRVVDRIVDAGGTAMFGETLEWLGAEHVLARRAVRPEIGAAIVAAVKRRESAVAATGVDLTGNNPGAENIRGGLSTIEEKSLGAIAKSGSRPIAGLLGIAEVPSAPGLYVMDAPGFSPESMTGFAAAGAQVMMFTTGAGQQLLQRDRADDQDQRSSGHGAQAREPDRFRRERRLRRTRGSRRRGRSIAGARSRHELRHAHMGRGPGRAFRIGRSGRRIAVVPAMRPTTGLAPSEAPGVAGTISCDAMAVHADDDVAVALRDIASGEAVGVRKCLDPAIHRVVVRDAIPLGHKFALHALVAGAQIRKYGESIGVAKVDIAPGAHVHVHNLASQRARRPA